MRTEISFFSLFSLAHAPVFGGLAELFASPGDDKPGMLLRRQPVPISPSYEKAIITWRHCSEGAGLMGETSTPNSSLPWTWKRDNG